jgi:hypothetical protein
VLLKKKLVSGSFLVLSLLYLAQTLLIKPDPAATAKYHLTSTSARLLGLTIAIPYLIIWLIALVGYLRLYTYHNSIKTDRDGEAFKSISAGVFGLGIFLPISTILSTQSNYYILHHASAAAPATRLVNYINIAIILLAVIAIHKGSEKLLTFVKSKDRIGYAAPYLISTLVFIAFSAIYVYLVMHDPTRQHPTAAVQRAGYYQPDWVILLTIVIPRILTWYVGLRAALNIYTYMKLVKGSIYRLALRDLAYGIIGVIVSIIFLRCLQTISVTLAKLSLGLLLALIYILLIVISVGYIFIARGTNKLQKLEEI